MSMRYLLYAVLSFVLCCIISCTGVTHDSGNNTQNDILALFEQAKEYECKGDAGKALILAGFTAVSSWQGADSTIE